MNSKEFLDEVKNSDLCPENFEEIYAEFQDYQKAALDTLKEFHRVCEKNSIPYQLAFGSLIGFARDGGQIPWDYDIDVLLFHDQREKLVEALKNDLDPRFYFYCPENNKKCRHLIIRIAPVEFRTEALHVDVFFLIGAPEDENERKTFVMRIKRLAEVRFGKLVNIKEESVGNIRSALRLLYRKLRVLFEDLKKTESEYKKVCVEYPLSSSKYCVMADTFANWKRILPIELFSETTVKECDYGEIRIPAHYEEILNLFYGDYKSIPPLDCRINEVVHHHNRIKTFQSKFAKKTGRQ